MIQIKTNKIAHKKKGGSTNKHRETMPSFKNVIPISCELQLFQTFGQSESLNGKTFSHHISLQFPLYSAITSFDLDQVVQL